MTTENSARETTREVAAIFHDRQALEAAVEKLTDNGFVAGDINVMATHKTVAEKLGDTYEAVEIMEDDPRVPRQAFTPRNDRHLAEAAVVGAPMYVLGLAGALAVVATGGAAALAAAVAAAGGVAGAGLGGLLARALERRHADRLADSMVEGGLVLWVHTDDAERERTAIEVLTAAGGEHVHAHDIARVWGTDDIQLRHFNPDPFLD